MLVICTVWVLINGHVDMLRLKGTVVDKNTTEYLIKLDKGQPLDVNPLWIPQEQCKETK